MIGYLFAGWAALSLALLVVGAALVTADERVATIDVGGRRAKSGTFLLTAVADRLGAPLTRPVLRLLAPWRARILRRIDAAGRPDGMTLESYARQTAGYVILFGGAGLLMLANGRRQIGLLLLAGAAFNEILLFSRARKRQDEIQRTMPDFMDVLAVTVAAGLSFRLALGRVAESMPGALAEEVTISLRQMDLGTPRREAFEDLRRRNGAEALRQFVTAILQAEELGAPLATALMDIAKDMRRDSAQWAKRKAQRTSPKVTGITTVLTLPSLMAVLIGAMYYGLVGDVPGGLFGGG